MAWVAIGVGVSIASVGASVGMSLAGVGQATQPDLQSSSRALSDTNAALLPIQRGMEAAMQSGDDYNFRLPDGFDASSFGVKPTQAGFYDERGNFVSADPNYLDSRSNPTEVAEPTRTNDKNQAPNGTNSVKQPLSTSAQKMGGDSKSGGKNLVWKPSTADYKGIPLTQNADGSYTAHFKGYGQADVQGLIADKTAASKLDLSKKYDSQFIAEALKQQKLADPESFAARELESKLIQDQINRPVNSPVSELLDKQVQDSLNAANGDRLTGLDQERLAAAVAQAQADRGGSSGPADFSQPLTTGFAGEQRKQNAAQAAMGFLSSGSSPEDIAYRREQQNLGNLAAEVSGKTPQSQFGSMSGAQNGPTPTMTANPLPVMPGDQSQAAAGVAMQNANTANRASNSQANPWMTGLSSLINVGSIAGQMGWKPFSA